MLEKIKTLVSIANDEDGIWVNDCYKSQGLYETDTSALQDRYQVLVDESLAEVDGEYLILTDKGHEIIKFMQLPYQHMIKSVQQMQRHYSSSNADCTGELSMISSVLGPIAHQSKWNYSPVN